MALVDWSTNTTLLVSNVQVVSTALEWPDAVLRVGTIELTGQTTSPPPDFGGATLHSDLTDVPAGSSHVVVRRKTSDQSNNLITLTDVADLSFPLAASQSMAFEFTVYFISAAATTGIGLAVNGPVGVSHIRAGMLIPTSATAVVNGVATAYEAVVLGTGGLTGSPLCAQVRGHVINGAVAGNLTLRFRSEVATSAVTVQRGSWGWAA